MTTLRRILSIVAVVLVVWALAASVAAQTASDGGGASADPKTIWITSIIGFLTVLVTQLFAIWQKHQESRASERRREQEAASAERQRQWDLEDRARARDELRQQYEAQRRETIATAAEIARINLQNTRRIVDEVTKNTAITEDVGRKADAAFAAGNDFNRRMDDMRKQLYEKGTQIDTIEEVSQDTNEKVTDLKQGK